MSRSLNRIAPVSLLSSARYVLHLFLFLLLFLACCLAVQHNQPIWQRQIFPARRFSQTAPTTPPTRVSSKPRTEAKRSTLICMPTTSRIRESFSGLVQPIPNTFTSPLSKTSRRSSEEVCNPRYPHILLFQDREWVDFLISETRLQVLHCSLRFPTIALAWQYVARYWDEASFSYQHWSTWIPLATALGADFFRPAQLRDSTEPYSYNFLVNIRKVGDSYELEIKSADEKSRALVMLNVNFHVVGVKRLPPKN